MSFTVTIPVANIASANAALQAAGWGPGNFQTPIYTTGALPAFAVLQHIGNDAAFQAACATLPGAVVRTAGLLVENMAATTAAVSGRWGANAPLLQGPVTPGLYRAIPADGGALWTVVQAFNRAITLNPLADIPALVRKAKVPGEIAPWVQPLDQFDAYLLLNPFTGQPDQVTHLGQTWRVSQASGTGGPLGSFNTFAPGVFGWTVV